jgi:hypothetical protein
MFQNPRVTFIVVIIVVLVLVLFFGSWMGVSSAPTEKFSVDGSNELDAQWYLPTAGVEDMLIDNMQCSPLCCGDQWQVPFDGLTAPEIQRALIENGRDDYGRDTGYVRTNYNCGNGLGGVGCPCIPKKTYKFLANRGNNAYNLTEVEPTFMIHNDLVPPAGLVSPENYYDWSPYQRVQLAKSMYAAQPKLNDLQYQRTPQSVQNVQSYGSAIPTKDVQVYQAAPMVAATASVKPANA